MVKCTGVACFVLPQTQHPGVPIKVPRRWLRVKRNSAFGELKWYMISLRFDSPDVATCHQTVEASLAPPSTAWQRIASVKDPKEKGLLLHPPLSFHLGGFSLCPRMGPFGSMNSLEGYSPCQSEHHSQRLQCSRIMILTSISLSITQFPPEQRVDQDGVISLRAYFASLGGSLC